MWLRQLFSLPPALSLSVCTSLFGLGICVGAILWLKVDGLAYLQPELLVIEDKTQTTTSIASFSAAIVGAVKNPGVYQLPLDSVVADLLQRAGGIDESQIDVAAFEQHVELAARINPESTIRIPRKTKERISSQTREGLDSMNINTATAKQLEHLPGIGEKLANEIIQKRPFINMQDMQYKVTLPEKHIKEIEKVIQF